jgi:hypothetical protein
MDSNTSFCDRTMRLYNAQISDFLYDCQKLPMDCQEKVGDLNPYGQKNIIVNL